jgi:hypothetical protein
MPYLAPLPIAEDPLFLSFYADVVQEKGEHWKELYYQYSD